MTVPFSQLWREAAGGKSIGRILTNQALLQWREELLGLVLDLACGQSPSYRRILKIKGNMPPVESGLTDLRSLAHDHQPLVMEMQSYLPS